MQSCQLDECFEGIANSHAVLQGCVDMQQPSCAGMQQRCGSGLVVGQRLRLVLACPLLCQNSDEFLCLDAPVASQLSNLQPFSIADVWPGQPARATSMHALHPWACVLQSDTKKDET